MGQTMLFTVARSASLQLLGPNTVLKKTLGAKQEFVEAKSKCTSHPNMVKQVDYFFQKKMSHPVILKNSSGI